MVTAKSAHDAKELTRCDNQGSGPQSKLGLVNTGPSAGLGHFRDEFAF
ncbi:hypothetical protein [Mycolicibacterium sp. 018/SC-01/001]|nr:hypothetical protein [Mycolicibacterium sp. 018/SC-01/001]